MASMPSRPYDALYDPTYTVSGARDHFRQQGQSAGFLVEKVAEHTNLFSELQHYPTATFRLKSNDKLPAFVDRSFHPHQPSLTQLKQQSQAAQVNGPHQHKYFRRPHLPPGMRAAVPLHLAPPTSQTPPQPKPPEPFIKEAATQSDYRESETQTLPWSPDWVLPTDTATLAKQALLGKKFDCHGPEVLQLADLKFGDGLPGGLQEVRRLEKMREKRAFEATLPPIDDGSRLPERQAMIEAWEAAEWAEREEEIKGVQEERLSLLAMALQVREEEIEEAHRAQLSQRTSARLSSRAPLFAAIHNTRIKTIRQLASKRKQVDILSKGSTQRKSIIDKYADYGSAVYAPLQREGQFPDVVKAAEGSKGPLSNSSQRPLLDADALIPSSLTGLQELQASIPQGALQPRLHRPKPPAKLNYSQRIAAAVQHDVECISDLLNTAKETEGRGIGQVWPYPVSEAQGTSVSCASGRSSRNAPAPMQSASSAVSSDCPGAGGSATKVKTGAHEAMPTPQAPPLADASGQHAALVLLQRLLRGRAVQSEMYAGKTAKLPLVRELRLGLEATAGCQARPEACDAYTQELDAVIGAAVCRVCCLLASDDEEAVTKLLLSLAAKDEQQKQLQEQSSCHLEGMAAEPMHTEHQAMAGMPNTKAAQECLSDSQLQQQHDNAEQPLEHVKSERDEELHQLDVSDKAQQQPQQCKETSQIVATSVQGPHVVDTAAAESANDLEERQPNRHPVHPIDEGGGKVVQQLQQCEETSLVVTTSVQCPQEVDTAAAESANDLKGGQPDGHVVHPADEGGSEDLQEPHGVDTAAAESAVGLEEGQPDEHVVHLTDERSSADVQCPHEMDTAPAEPVNGLSGSSGGQPGEHVGHPADEQSTENQVKEEAASENSSSRITGSSAEQTLELAAFRDRSEGCGEVLEQQPQSLQGQMSAEAAQAEVADQASAHNIVNEMRTWPSGTEQQHQLLAPLAKADHNSDDSSTSAAGATQSNQAQASGTTDNYEPSLNGGWAQAAMASGATISGYSAADGISTVSLGIGVAVETSVGSVHFGAFEAKDDHQSEAVAEPSSPGQSDSSSSGSSSSSSTGTADEE